MRKKVVIILSLMLTVTMLFLILMASCKGAAAVETTAAAVETSAAGTTVEDTAVVAGAEGACADCHNNTTLIVSKTVQWENSLHGSGLTFERNGADCAICHTSEGFTERIDAGTFEIAEDVKNPSPINCRTCHNIHDTYTSADWALAVTDPVKLELTGDTYDKGDSNICATCHQPRVSYEIPKKGGEDIEITSVRFGPHHGPQSSMLLGVGGYGDEYKGSNVHDDAIDDGCLSCHMTDSAFGKQAGGHTFSLTYEFHGEESQYLAGCLKCHEDIENFDRNEAQTEIAGMLEEVRVLLVAQGLIVGDNEEGTIPNGIEGTFTSEQAGALWNYKTVVEDRSLGVHNPGFTKYLLETALEALKK